MKGLIVFMLIIIVVFTSCRESALNKSDQNKHNGTVLSEKRMPVTDSKNKSKIQESYFVARGNEPFWRLSVSEQRIKLEFVGDSIVTPHTPPTVSDGVNVKKYTIQTERAGLKIEIHRIDCKNDMSGRTSPYSVNVNFKEGDTMEATRLEGCGEYITDYRLHDIWVLESLNGSEVQIENFKKERPTMEINYSSNTFMGYAGCNQMNGKLIFERNALRFKDIVTTKMQCGDSNQESEFLIALESSTSYKIEENRLWLFNDSGPLITFRKID